MSKAKQLREALPTSAPGITGDQLAEKANISRGSLTTVMWAFLNRGEILVTEGKGDEADRFYLNADYGVRKGGGRKKRKVKKPAAKKVKGKQRAQRKRAAASVDMRGASADEVARVQRASVATEDLALMHMMSTLATLEIAIAKLPEAVGPALQAHKEAVLMVAAG